MIKISTNIQMPSRYLGNEINSFHKNWKTTHVHIALAFPDLYEIGTSHLGIQILYSTLNNYKKILAERVFTPAHDMEKKIRYKKQELKSLESNTALKKFDILGFSLMHEMNYTNALNMLNLAKIPLISKKRNNKLPLIIAGGPCTFNPEPIADFFDALVIGDGEKVISKMTTCWIQWKTSKNNYKNVLLKEWAKIKGVYIPSFYKPIYNLTKNQKLIAKYQKFSQVKKFTISNLEKVPLHSNPIIPYANPIHDRLKIELSRGCTRGCRFCQAGMIYRPIRERSYNSTFNFIKKAISKTGYESISLLSLSTGDYSHILPLIKNLINWGGKKNISIHLPSLHVETLTPNIINLIKMTKKTGFTIAPETGSKRLSKIINKNIQEKDIIKTVKLAFSLGWKVIKLYFVIGFPTERKEDLNQIIELVKKLNTIRKSTKKTVINISIGTFIPKAHTPFQWIKQNKLEESKNKIYWIKNNIKMQGVNLKWQDPHISYIEGKITRGNRKTSALLINAFKKGCNFDSWSNYFNFNIWNNSINNINTKNKQLHNLKGYSVILPWDHIKTGIKKSFFLQEWKKSIKQEKTLNCNIYKCQNCGICKNKTTVFKQTQYLKEKKNKIKKDILFKNVKILFSKTKKAKFFGHLEIVKIFHRSLRRAKLTLKYSQGFNPSPKLSFNDTLPIGLESMNEFINIVILKTTKISNLKTILNTNYQTV